MNNNIWQILTFMALVPQKLRHQEKFPRDSLGGQGERDRPEVKIFLKPPLKFNPYFYFQPKTKSPEHFKFILTLTFGFDKDTQMSKSFASLVIVDFKVYNY